MTLLFLQLEGKIHLQVIIRHFRRNYNLGSTRGMMIDNDIITFEVLRKALVMSEIFYLVLLFLTFPLARGGPY